MSALWKTLLNRERRNKPQTEKIFAKHTTDKGLVYRIYKDPAELKNKKIKSSNLKMAKRFEQTLPQRGYTDGK